MKYSYGNNKIVKAKIYNFSTISGQYQNVLGKLNGIYYRKDGKLNSIEFSNGMVTYRNQDEIYWYSSSNADEQGNYGTVLYGAKNAHGLYIVINNDNTITVGSADLADNKHYIYSK